MRDEAKKYHLEVLAEHNRVLFETLLYTHNVTSENLKQIEFEDVTDLQQGYFARKDKTKYWIPREHYDFLPFRIKNTTELHYKDDVIVQPTKISKFKIEPSNTTTVREIVDSFCPFTHTQPIDWTLMKIMTISSFIGKVCACIATPSHFGKTSTFDVLHGITDKSPVFKPRSTPGVLNKINMDGVVVFDEVHDCKREVKDIMEEFALAVGGNKSVYINGAMRASKTKSKYDVSMQSIVFLYNTTNQYKTPEKDYFDFIFSNNKAIDDRFLKFKLDGELTEVFDRDFDIPKVAEDNKGYYIQLAKEFAFLKEQKRHNSYKRRWVTSFELLKIKGRRRAVLDEITWLLDQYCQSQEEYDGYMKRIESSILNYKEMVSGVSGEVVAVVREEEVV